MPCVIVSVGSLVNTVSIFSHGSLQTRLLSPALLIGSDGMRRGSPNSQRGHSHFLSPTSEWHALGWIGFKSLIICPHGHPSRAAVSVSKHASRSMCKKGNFLEMQSKASLRSEWVFVCASIICISLAVDKKANMTVTWIEDGTVAW